MNEAPKTLEEALNQEGAKKYKWTTVVESAAVNFFNEYELERMSLEDGKGNKAKLSRTKDNAIKVESSSTTML